MQALLAAVYAEYGQVLELDTLDADLTRLEAAYASPSAFRLLLDGPGEDASLLGTAAVTIRSGAGEPGRPATTEAELKRMFLRPEARGQGFGRRLLTWAQEHARSQDARALQIWSDLTFTRSHGFYARAGAVDSGARRQLGGRNDVAERHFELAL